MRTEIIAAIFLVSCASTEKQAETAVKAVKSCSYLADYADDMTDALNAHDWNLALNIAGQAYMRSLEDENAPCLKGAKELTNQATKFIIEQANGVDQ
jgi:hypothetical protein